MTAVVDPSARIAPDVEIGPFCVIGPEVEIGRGTRLLGRVTVTGRAKIGERNILHPTCAIGGPPQDERPAATDGRIEIGDDNVFREAVTVNLPKTPRGVTRIGSRNRFAHGSHVAHDVAIDDDVVLEKLALLGGHARIHSNVVLGPLTVVHQFVTVGRGVRLRRLSGVSEDAAPFLVYDGANTPIGVHRGLKLPAATLAALDEAFEIVYEHELPRSEAVAQLEASPVPEVREMAAILAAAQKGRMGRALEARRG